MAWFRREQTPLPPRAARVIAETGLGADEPKVNDKTPTSDTRPDAELSVDALLKRFGIK